MICLLSGQASAARVSDIANTVHNLSANWGGVGSDNRNVKATSETRICIFCHTPHAAENITGAPLWNRGLSSATYTMYSSSSMEAATPSGPSDSSKLCLSCHDGTLAIGAVNVMNGNFTDQDPLTEDITMVGTNAGKINDGSGATTGYTGNLGVDLSNDHPISITFDAALAAADGELRDPAVEPHLGTPSSGVRFDLPLPTDHVDGESKVECVSCHDPHIRDSSGENIMFLRLNRFQSNAAPAVDTFNTANDIICLGCHRKDGYQNSVHANPLVADEVYTTAAAGQREFPDALPVWRASCLNCHDVHTVQGARRLLREGTDSTATPKTGGNAASEETCYQCHSSDGGVLTSQGFGTQVPDIKSDLQLARRMPIASVDQPAGTEVHDIGNSGVAGDGKDMVETAANLGKGNLMNRHAECSDCHNPHRTIKKRLASDLGQDNATPDAAGTHRHEANLQHTNLVSGVLRGAWGVEPIYSTPAFDPVSPGITYDVKRGVQPEGVDMSGDPSTYSYVTREYQICLKCHSDYGFDNANPPALGYNGGTPSGTNNVTVYTNQAMEFQGPDADKGEPGGNHRSWHPVIEPTGRTIVERGNMDQSGFLSPWGDVGGTNIGNQTMFCTDCHGSGVTGTGSTPDGGEDGNPWGPHGSNNDFILKGGWSNLTGDNTPDALCFKCHDYDQYANPVTPVALDSGFSGPIGTTGGGGGAGNCNMDEYANNLHIGHSARMGGMRCNWCHAAVPHGWKNKAFLVDISQEVAAAPYTSGPYYNQAWLGGGGAVIWKASGNWTKDDCGGAWMNNSCTPTP